MADPNFVEVATLVVAIGGLAIAGYQISAARRESRRASAVSLYNRYLELAFEHPELAYAFERADYDELMAGPNRARYEFYVSILLFAVESILEVSSEDERNDWRETLMDQLRYHVHYIKNDPSIQTHYTGELKGMIRRVINESLGTAT